jgi:hypothetical protein
VLKEKANSWHHGLSPSSRQDRLESILLALKGLADVGLGEASVLSILHHRWIVPLMERELHIYEMSETANPVSLARSRLLHDRFPPEYTATRARRAISLKAIRHGNDDLWSFVMLPEAPALSRLPSSFIPSRRAEVILTFPISSRGWPWTPRGPTCSRLEPERTHAAQRREQERAAHKKERSIWRRERREQWDKEYQLREQQGLSRPAASEYSPSSEEEEESDGGRAPPERWDPAPTSPRAAEAVEEQAPGASVEAPAAGQSVEGTTHSTEALARAAEVSGSAAVATTAATTRPVEPSRKRK